MLTCRTGKTLANTRQLNATFRVKSGQPPKWDAILSFPHWTFWKRIYKWELVGIT